ncbi:hypothetical protein [uncultured Dialister sp.]|uniref:hypothetical protein n=1 Tax=uncultured Dialister sp. TaxID=278064 RepID=UPI00258F1F88|nr:hypothetical protein [uncultured Dialister sp.]
MERSPQIYVKPSSGVTSNDRGWEDFRENDVPCHHLPAGMQKKIHLADKVDSRQAKEIGFRIHTFPSLVGQTVIQNRQFS